MDAVANTTGAVGSAAQKPGRDPVMQWFQTFTAVLVAVIGGIPLGLLLTAVLVREIGF